MLGPIIVKIYIEKHTPHALFCAILPILPLTKWLIKWYNKHNSVNILKGSPLGACRMATENI